MLPRVPAPPGPEPTQVAGQLGVPAQAGVAQQGAEDSVETLKQGLAALRAQIDEKDTLHETNIRRLSSSYDTQLAQTRRENQESIKYWEEQAHAATTKDMDELGKTQYEYGVALQKLEEREQEIASLQQRTQEAQMSAGYTRQFIAAGVDPRKLDYTSLESLLTSGWAGILNDRQETANKVKELEMQVNTLRGPSAQGTPAPVLRPGELTPPRVAGPLAGAPVAPNTDLNNWGPTLAAVKAAYGRDVSVSEILDMVQAGKLPVTLLPGMEGYSPEAFYAEE